MTYIVLDLEWNQPFFGQAPYAVPFPLVGEIVQFGAVKLNDAFLPAERYRAFVRPRFYPRLHPYVKRITGITDSVLRGAPEFPEALELFWEFCGEDFAFLTWGPDDVPMLCDNMLANGLDTASIPPTYNLQHIFNRQKTDEDKQLSLSDACDFLGIRRELPDHDALADAYHTACICGFLDMARGLSEYTHDIRPERHYTHPVRRKKSPSFPDKLSESRLGLFPTRSAVFSDPGMPAAACPVCGGPLECDRFFTQTKNKRAAAARCAEHGEFLAKLFFYPEEQGGYQAVLRLYPMTDGIRASLDRLARRKKK